MITVANNTYTAARIKYAFDHGKVRIEELCDPERTLHIDSKVLDTAEAAEEPVAPLGAAEESEDETDDEPKQRKLTKAEQAELLRQQVDTVGQPGKPGGHIQNVISVGMLSEGWDAKTVTHIMGLRAFTSQLLCEQVVGRGLRRTSYETTRVPDPISGEEIDLYEPEYVNIFGVPFTFLPHESPSEVVPPPPVPKTLVEPIPEKAEFEIKWPNVVRIDHVYRPRLTLEWQRVEPLELDVSRTAQIAELAPIVEGKPDITKITEIDLERLAREFRTQRIIFETARDVYDQMQADWKGSKEYLLAQLVRLVEEFIRSDKIAITPALFNQDNLRRRLIITLNMTKVVHHIWEAIRFENTERLEPQFDQAKPIRSTGDMLPWRTGKPCELTRRSHINVCVYDGAWEAAEAYELDRNPTVSAWAKNDHLGFEILYVHRGVVRKYRPDFIIRLASGEHLVLEVKGRDTEQDQTKRRFLDEWVRAVNEHGGFGHWRWDVSKDPADIKDILAGAVSSEAKVPDQPYQADELISLGQVVIRIEDPGGSSDPREGAQRFLEILKAVIDRDAKDSLHGSGWDVSNYQIHEGCVILSIRMAVKKWKFVGMLCGGLYASISQYPSFRDGLELLYNDFNGLLDSASQLFQNDTGMAVATVRTEREDPAKLFERYGKYVIREDEPRIE